MISTAEKLASAQRELGMRKRVYPRWVEQGKMKQAAADREIEIMQAIVDDYLAETAKERLL